MEAGAWFGKVFRSLLADDLKCIERFEPFLKVSERTIRFFFRQFRFDEGVRFPFVRDQKVDFPFFLVPHIVEFEEAVSIIRPVVAGPEEMDRDEVLQAASWIFKDRPVIEIDFFLAP